MTSPKKLLNNPPIVPKPLPQELADFEEDWLQEDEVSEFRNLTLDDEY